LQLSVRLPQKTTPRRASDGGVVSAETASDFGDERSIENVHIEEDAKGSHIEPHCILC
jgi:hypothetical protein